MLRLVRTLGTHTVNLPLQSIVYCWLRFLEDSLDNMLQYVEHAIVGIGAA